MLLTWPFWVVLPSCVFICLWFITSNFSLRSEIALLTTQIDDMSVRHSAMVLSLTKDRDEATKALNDLQDKFKTNPSYECQQLLADMLAGDAIYRIERLERENLYYRRGEE